MVHDLQQAVTDQTLGERQLRVVAQTAGQRAYREPRRFRDEFPRVHLELRELATGMQLVALRTGELDVGFLREPPPDHQLKSETVMREPLLIALESLPELRSRLEALVRVGDRRWNVELASGATVALPE